ncbi:unnamed protein product [Diamesa serratosioi]
MKLSSVSDGLMVQIIQCKEQQRQSGPIIEIISYESVNNGDGSYKFSYESANGIKAEETGDVKNKGTDNAIQTVQGSYSYTSPEGQLIEITYVADENGFQPQGDSLPTPVPLPEEYLKALAEFEAAYATAVPDTAGAGGNGGGGGGGGGAGKPSGGNSGSSYPGGPSSQGYPGAQSGAGGARPQGPAAGARPQGNAPKPAAGGQGGSFPGQPRPAGGKPIPIISQEQEINYDGSYKWAYETGNGIQAEEQGYQKEIPGQEEKANTVQGRYSYTAPDGQLIEVTYIADENGFQPQGAHLPTPPPIPEAIQRALEYLAAADIKEKANEITRFDSVVNPDSYQYAYETGGAIKAQEEGSLKASALGGEEAIGDDGKTYSLSYTADENGYRPTGDHLPTPPPVPPAIAQIQKGLDLIYAGIKIQEERRRNNPNYAADKEERDRLNYLGLYIGN